MWKLKKNFIQPLIKKKLNGSFWHSNQTLALPKYYIQNASLEISWVKNPLSKNSISGTKIKPFFSSEYEGFDINTAEDLKIALVLSKKILKFIMKKILILNISISPHFETSLEIVIENVKREQSVFFLGRDDLPWSDWELSKYKKMLFFSYSYKIKALEF